MTNPTPTDVNTLIERLEALDAAATKGPWAVTSTVGDVHSQARNGQNWICQGPNLHAPSTPPVSEIHANAQLIAEVRTALPDLIQALRAPTVDAAVVIMKASRCGHHFDEKCLACQSALDCTNREMERLRTQAIKASQALRAMQARVGALEEALGSFIPTNMSLSRPDVIPDETIVPLDVTMGDLRRARSTQQEAQRHGE